MPYLIDHELLFVHIPKNAGRSIEAAIMPEILEPRMHVRSLFNRAVTWLSRRTAPTCSHRLLHTTLDVTLAAQHLTYVEIEMLNLAPKALLRKEKCFCVCRDPFDRAVSSVAHFLGPQDDPRTFERALESWLDCDPRDHNEAAHRRTQASFVTDRTGRRAVGTVLRFEALEKDFAHLCERTGLNATLPWHGKAQRGRDLDALYTSRSRQLILSAFEEDFDAFGYSTGL